MAIEGPRDIIVNVFEGMCADVRHMFEEERYPAFIVLAYAAMDAISNATRFTNKNPAPKRDFVDWVSRYLNIPGPAKPSPDELWNARCAIVHSYGVANEKHVNDSNLRLITLVRSSNLSTTQKFVGGKPFLFVDIKAFHDAFQNAVQESLTSAIKDSNRRPVVEQRLTEFVQAIPIDPDGPVGKFLDS